MEQTLLPSLNGTAKVRLYNETAKFFFGNLFSRISYSLLLQFLKFPLVEKIISEIF